MNALLFLAAAAVSNIVPMPAAVVQVHGPDGRFCSGVIVRADGIVLTAEHCGCLAKCRILYRDEKYDARVIYDPPKNERDEATLIQIDSDDEFAFLPLAESSPKVGDTVEAFGWPARNAAWHHGRIKSVDGNFLWTDFRIYEGNSGGPLVCDGQVIALASGRSDLNDEPYSLWIPLASLQSAMAHAPERPIEMLAGARRAIDSPTSFAKAQKPTLVAFVAGDFPCPPCAGFESQVKDGKLGDYQVEFVRYLRMKGTWDRPDVYAEFYTKCQPKSDELKFPTFWVRGTSSYRVGYSDRGGLLNWIGGVITKLGEAIFGKPGPNPFDPPLVPSPDPIGQAEPSKPDESGEPKKHNDQDVAPPVPPPPFDIPSPYEQDVEQKISTLKARIELLISEAKETKELVVDFKGAGLIGKARLINDAIHQKNDVTENVTAIKSEVKDLRDDFRANPKGVLVGLIGLITGLLHRRFAA